jgi:type I restriction enzyme, R subunit
LYDNLDKDEPLTIAMDSAVIYGKHGDWEGTLSKVKNKVVKPVLEEYKKSEKLDPIFEVIKQQKEYK